MLALPLLLQCRRKEIGPLRIMSYNVRNCKGMDNAVDFIYGYNNGYNYIVAGSKVLEEPVASDHRPLTVDIHIR